MIESDLGLIRQRLARVGHTVFGSVDEIFEQRNGDGLANGSQIPEFLASVVRGIEKNLAIARVVVVSMLSSRGPEHANETSDFVHGHGHDAGWGDMMKESGVARCINDLES